MEINQTGLRETLNSFFVIYSTNILQK
jgi:hypothetical protein